MSETQVRPAFQSSETMNLVRGGGVDIIPSGEFATEEMILNIGPQHPSTHGVLRIVIDLDGEVITRADPVIGYMHRGAEKLA
jgi:NADH-quinone oxidoreductase subunit D